VRICSLVTALFLVAGWTWARGATIEVPGDYPVIQQAINAAVNGDTVLVSPGTYSGSGNRNLDFGGRRISVVSVGGATSALIDCGGVGRGFYLHTGETLDALIDGFTIANGYADDGGGVRCADGAGVTIRRCVIRNNVAIYGGGGVSCWYAGVVYLEDVTFSQNSARYGGGLIATSTGPLGLKGCRFTENTGTYTGGLRCEASPATLNDVTFAGNVGTATVGGMSCFDAAGYVLSGVVFLGNHAPVCGGFGGARATAALTNCTFAENSAVQGGGVNCGPNSQFNLRQCIVAYQQGGGAIYCEPGSLPPSITHCCAYGNSGGDELCGDHWENLSVDPLFCALADEDLTLREGSPCLPGGNEWGELIGALGEGCGATPVAKSTWGALKTMYR
jgi:predicted outer membrane repeat protein